MKHRFSIGILSLIFSLTACYDFSVFEDCEVEVEAFSPSFIFPLIKDSLSIQQMLEKNDSVFVKELADHSLSIVIADSSDINFTSDPEQFNIPDQSFSETVTIPSIPTGNASGEISYAFSSGDFNHTFVTETASGGSVELKRVDFSTATLQVQITNSFYHPVENATITFKSLLDDQGDPLIMDFSLANYGSTYNNTIELNHYYLNAYNTAEDLYNNFCFCVDGTLITITGNPVNTGDNLAVQINIQDPVFEKVTGKINYTLTETNDSISIDIFPTSDEAQWHVADPKFNLYFKNSYGIPIACSITDFVFTDSLDQPISMTATGTGSEDLKIGIPNNLNYITGTQQSISTTFTLDQYNSNIAELFNNKPTSVKLATNIKVGDNTSNHDYFMYQSSNIQVKSEIEIPVYGWIRIKFSDTIDLDLPEYHDEVDLENAIITLHLTVNNEIPLNAYLQATFLDSNDDFITALFDEVDDELLIESAEVDSEGTTVNPMIKTSHISISQEKYDQMLTATKMVLTYRMITGGDDKQDIKVLSSNQIEINASISITGTVTP